MRCRSRLFLSVGLLFGSLLGGSSAESSSTPPSSSSSSKSGTATSATSSGSAASSSGASSTPQVHKVNVGTGGFTYDPNTTYANPGDTVVFEFFPTNHSVIRAEYTDAPSCPRGGCNPCVPYELIHPGGAGFHSPNVLTQNVDPNQAITWNLTINDTQPIFFYCNALQSCHPNGMVGVINPNETVSLQKQLDAAIAAPYELGPGQPFPAEGNGGGMTASSGAASATPTSTSSPTSSPGSGGGNHSLAGGAIAGIAVGSVAVVLLAAALFYFVGRSKTYHDFLTGKSSAGSAPPGNASQVGDLGPWSPMSQQHAGDHRFSGMTSYSHVQGPADSTFVGYNRQTGAPEFAAEAPLQPHHNKSPFVSPLLNQHGFPAQTHSAELPGDGPPVSEVAGPEKI